MADIGVCADANVTYAHRVNDPDNYNWCIVPDSAYDAVLFAGVALLVACVVSGRLSAVWVLVAGALCEVASSRANLGRFGNSFALWLGGIHPGEVFFYTFLPPLLLDSAARLDYFVFKKVLVLSLVFAFVLVCTTTLLAVPLMLWGLGLGPRYGWGWADVALFNAMVASTDAVAVTSVLRAGGAPELLGALLEGESLFNDASGIVLFDIFLRKVLQARREAAKSESAEDLRQRFLLSDESNAGTIPADLVTANLHLRGVDGHAHRHLHPSPPPPPLLPSTPPPPAPPSPSSSSWPWPWPWPGGDGHVPPWLAALVPELGAVCREFAWLVVGGLAVGLACGLVMKWALRLLQWRRLKPHVEVSLTFAAGYLSFYIANAYLQSSGVIAVVVFGVYGAATGTWGISSQARRAGAFDRFWDVLAFCINGLVFFLLGASSVNYLIRLGTDLDGTDGGGSSRSLLLETLLMLPVMYVTLFAMRGLLIAAFCSSTRAIRLRSARRAAAKAAKGSPGGISGDDPTKPLPHHITHTHQHHHHHHHHQHHQQQQHPYDNASGTTGHAVPSLPNSQPHGHGHGKHHHHQHQHHHHRRHHDHDAESALAATPDWRGVIFATVGGLRGAVSLIMAQIVLAAISSSEGRGGAGGGEGGGASSVSLWGGGGGWPGGGGAGEGGGTTSEQRDKEVTAQMVVFTSGFVLMSLLVNAPLLTPLMTLLKLNTISPIKQQVRARAKAALWRFTANALTEMKAAAELADGTDGSGGLDMSEMLLRGVDWAAVEKLVDLGSKLEAVFPGAPPAAASSAAPPPPPPPPPTTTTTTTRAGGGAAGEPGGGSGGAAAAEAAAMKRQQSMKRQASRRQRHPTAAAAVARTASGLLEPLLGQQATGGDHDEEGPTRVLSRTAPSGTSRGSSTLRFEEPPAPALPQVPGGAAAAEGEARGREHKAPQPVAADSGAANTGGASKGGTPPPSSGALLTVFSLPRAAAATAAAIAAAGGDANSLSAVNPLVQGAIAAAAGAAAPEAAAATSVEAAGPGARRMPSRSLSMMVKRGSGEGLEEGDLDAGGGGTAGDAAAAGGGAASAVTGQSSLRLRRSATMTTSLAVAAASTASSVGAVPDMERSRMLDEQFAALQGDDAGAMAECPFASYTRRSTGAEKPRRAPRDSIGASASTAATSPRASISNPPAGPGGAAATGPAPMPVPPAPHAQYDGGRTADTAVLSSAGERSVAITVPATPPSPPGESLGRRQLQASPPALRPSPPYGGDSGALRSSLDAGGQGTTSAAAGSATATATATAAEPAVSASPVGASRELMCVDSADGVVVGAAEPEQAAGGGGGAAVVQHKGDRSGGHWYGGGSDDNSTDFTEHVDEDDAGYGMTFAVVGHLGLADASRPSSMLSRTASSRTAAAAAQIAEHEGAGPGAEGYHIDHGVAAAESYNNGDPEDGEYNVGDGDGDAGLMSSSAPASYSGGMDRASAALRRANVGGGGGSTSAAGVGSPSVARPEQPAGALLETLAEGDEGEMDGESDEHAPAAAAAAAPTAVTPGSEVDVDADVDDGKPAEEATATASAGASEEMHRSRSAPALGALASPSPFSALAFAAESESGGAGDSGDTTVSQGAGGSESYGTLIPSGASLGSLPLGLSPAASNGGRMLGAMRSSELRAGLGGSDSGSGPNSLRRPHSSRQKRRSQTRMSPSFAIGSGASITVPGSRAGPSGLTRHLSLNKAANVAAAAAAATAPATAAGKSFEAPDAQGSFRISRQPSSRWVSVHSTDQGQGQQGQHLRRMAQLQRPQAAPQRPSQQQPGEGGPRLGAAAAETAAKAGQRGGEGKSGSLARSSWASLQDLAGQQRTLVAFEPLDEGPGTEAPGSTASTAAPSHRAPSHELLVEYRIRLLSGFKRFFHEETLEGVLSPSGMRLLCHCCDEALHQPWAPLDLWRSVEREVVGQGLVQWQAWAHLALRHGMQRTIRWDHWIYAPVKLLVVRPLRVVAEMLSSSLSRVMLVALEVAVELAAALSDHSPQLQWLRCAGPAGQEIWSEVAAQAEAVRRFILDRVIEAPDRFQATQSHRAALALLRQQVAFVRSMHKTGLVDGDEAEALAEPIERRIWRLEARGPRWQQPSLAQVLASSPMLRGCPSGLLDWIRAEGELYSFAKGADMSPLLAHGGVFIVVLGTVRVSLLPLATDTTSSATANAGVGTSGALLGHGAGAVPDPTTHQFYVGVGGVVGMSTALMGRSIPGMATAAAVAEGNTLGKGPVVFALPAAAAVAVRARAAAGQPAFQGLMLNMYRLVGGHVLERQRTTLVTHIAALLTGAVAHALRTGGRGRAARLRGLLVQQHAPGERSSTAAKVGTTSLRRKQKAVLDEVYHAPAAGLLSQPTSRPVGQRRGRGGAGESQEGSGDEYLEDESSSEGSSSESESGSNGSSGSSRRGSSRPSQAELDGSSAVESAVAAALAADEQLMSRCLERAVEIVEAVRQGIKGASLYILQPGQSLIQRSTVVLVNGSLLQHQPAPPPPDPDLHPQGQGGDHAAAGAESTAPPPAGRAGFARQLSRAYSSAGRDQGDLSGGVGSGDGGAGGCGGGQPGGLLGGIAPMPVFKPPTILLWLPDHCEPAVARIFRQSDFMRYTAGAQGATVLVCGPEGEATVVYK